MTARPLEFHPVSGLPEIRAGDDLAALVAEAVRTSALDLADAVVVVCQKVVSKAEGRSVRLADVEPSSEALRIAHEDDKDARQVELVLRESRRVVRHSRGILICETHHGFVCANAGVDLSNTAGPDEAVLLPLDPDASAARLRAGLREQLGLEVAVVVSDTFGRPWREGLVDVALGSAGISPLDDQRGRRDRQGRELVVTNMATVDQLAAAAGLLMDKGSGVPVVVVRGWSPAGDGRVRDLVRHPDEDLFR
ncbi:MAG: coenzyme F420-0:L-glutamate ligase [Proteobacteria bacterium]|nr:coenzyme F420-0:L-glutamate ligase [Pseudomonadota bacterium]